MIFTTFLLSSCYKVYYLFSEVQKEVGSHLFSETRTHAIRKYTYVILISNRT